MCIDLAAGFLCNVNLITLDLLVFNIMLLFQHQIAALVMATCNEFTGRAREALYAGVFVMPTSDFLMVWYNVASSASDTGLQVVNKIIP